jgi:phosphatidylserine/phosphatidylglycerophosphate/cardiolipin synthase-like enzyme
MSMFLIDIRRAFDPEREVRALLHALEESMWRGVDVRILIGDSRQVVQLREMNMVALAYLRAKRLTVRTHPLTRPGGTHDKYLVIDHSVVVLGSHNWIEECFNQTAEDSLAVVSPDLNRRLSQQFLATWAVKRGPSKASLTGE